MAEEQITVTFDLDFQGETYLHSVEGGMLAFHREGNGVRLAALGFDPLLTPDQAESYATNLLAAVTAARRGGDWEEPRPAGHVCSAACTHTRQVHGGER